MGIDDDKSEPSPEGEFDAQLGKYKGMIDEQAGLLTAGVDGALLAKKLEWIDKYTNIYKEKYKKLKTTEKKLAAVIKNAFRF